VFFPGRGFDTADYVADSRVLQRQKNNSTLFDFAIFGIFIKIQHIHRPAWIWT
jgi:hypothetical protein